MAPWKWNVLMPIRALLLRCDITTPGGTQTALRLELKYLRVWLAGISAERIKPGFKSASSGFAVSIGTTGTLRDKWR